MTTDLSAYRERVADVVAGAATEHAAHMETYTLPALQPGFIDGWMHALRLLMRDADFIGSKAADALLAPGGVVAEIVADQTRGMDALMEYETQKLAVSEAYWKGREQGAAEVRARVEAAPVRCPVHGIPDCSPLLNGCSIPNHIHAWRNTALADPGAERTERDGEQQ